MSEWTEVKICINASDVDKVGDIAIMTVPYGIYIEDYSNLEQEAWEIAHIDLIDEELLNKDRTKAYVHIYISPEDNPNEALSYLSERLNAMNVENKIITAKCQDSDWENSWKKYFNPIPVGEKLLIRPIWRDDYDAEERKVLNLEPGLAFGTGTHETTRLCIETLEKCIKPGMNVLDLGCGSGILSIASLLLGAKSALGVDIDALAVKTAKENGRLNNMGEPELTFIHGDLTQKVSGKYDVVVANIVADVIIRFCANAATFMHKDSLFITSGIIDSREQDVLDAFEKYGFSVLDRHIKKNWVCFECRIKEK